MKKGGGSGARLPWCTPAPSTGGREGRQQNGTGVTARTPRRRYATRNSETDGLRILSSSLSVVARTTSFLENEKGEPAPAACVATTATSSSPSPSPSPAAAPASASVAFALAAGREGGRLRSGPLPASGSPRPIIFLGNWIWIHSSIIV
ncbi:hypothetical protein ZWY2020_007550 [Hordeum vulgare]|nr:hypothetical protein ZWY2020_007550 [Hordeum vulgare]